MVSSVTVDVLVFVACSCKHPNLDSPDANVGGMTSGEFVVRAPPLVGVFRITGVENTVGRHTMIEPDGS